MNSSDENQTLCVDCNKPCTRRSHRCRKCYEKNRVPLFIKITCLHCNREALKRRWNCVTPKYCSRECFFASIDTGRSAERRAKDREAAAARGSQSYRARCKRHGSYYNPSVTRRAVFERDSYKCSVCGVAVSENLPANHNRKATLDHVVPLEKKGPHDWHNVACCCSKCNRQKSNKWDGRQVLDFSGGWEKVNG